MKTKLAGRIFILLTILLALLCGAAMAENETTVVASGTCGKNVVWQLDSAGELTISGTGKMEDYTYYSSSVDPNMPWYPNNASISKVTVRDGVTSIGAYAFYRCGNLTSVTIPDSVTSIGKYAFAYCSSLPSLTVGSGVTTICDSAIEYCDSLTSISLPNGLTKIEGNVFWKCEGLKEVHVPSLKGWLGISFAHAYSNPMNYADKLYIGEELLTDAVLPEGTTKIGKFTFYHCYDLKKVTIPDSVTTIEENAFEGCKSLKGITLPDGLKSIGASAFNGCTALENIRIPDGMTSLSSYVFYSCTNLKSIDLPDSMAKIEDHAFAQCSNLRSIQLPESVTSIGQSAFYCCSRLSCVNIPSRVTKICDYTFYACNLLPCVTIPSGVTSIGVKAFYNCNSLEKILFLGKTMPSVGELAFGQSKRTIYCYKSSKVAAWAENSSHETVYIDDMDLTVPISLSLPRACEMSIGEQLTISAALLPEQKNAQVIWSSSNSSVVSVENGLLSALSTGEATITASYGNVSDSMNVTVYGVLISGECGDDLTWQLDTKGKLSISGTGKMNDYTSSYPSLAPWYTNRSSILEISIEEGVTSIGSFAFYGCTNPSSVSIPESVTSIGASAFYNCKNLVSVTLPESLTNLGNSAFYNCESLASVSIPKQVTSIGNSVFDGCKGLKSVAMPKTLTSIGNSAFYGCESLADISIPDQVTSIGYNAFYNCKSLASVSIPDQVTSIASYTFYGCSNLKSVYIPESVTNIGYCAFYGCDMLTDIWLTGRKAPSFTYKFPYEYSQNKVKIHCYEFSDAAAWAKENGYEIVYIELQKLVLPSGLTEIQSEAFLNGAAEYVVLPDGCETIGSRAFAACTNLVKVYMPDSVTSIASDAFTGCGNITFLCESDNAAAAYAKAAGLDYTIE